MPKKTTSSRSRSTPRTSHNPEILQGMSRGPWADMWASEAEEAGERLSGVNVYEEAPKTPSWAKTWARELADAVAMLNNASLEQLYEAAQVEGFAKNRETFGYYLGMQAVGHGVSWDDDIVGAHLKIRVPRTEFYQGASIDLRFVKPVQETTPSLSDFGHDDRKAVVSYRGTSIAVKTNRGWTPMPGAPSAIAKAVSNAIFASSDNVPASALRRRIGEELGL